MGYLDIQSRWLPTLNLMENFRVTSGTDFVPCKQEKKLNKSDVSRLLSAVLRTKGKKAESVSWPIHLIDATCREVGMGTWLFFKNIGSEAILISQRHGVRENCATFFP